MMTARRSSSSFFLQLGILFVAVLLLGELSVAETTIDLQHAQHQVLKWLQSDTIGGILSEHIELQAFDALHHNNNSNNHHHHHQNGHHFVATRDIAEGEILVVIPRKAILQPVEPQIGDRVIRRGEYFNDEDIDDDELFAGVITNVHSQKGIKVYDIDYDSGFSEQGIPASEMEFEYEPTCCATVQRLIDQLQQLNSPPSKKGKSLSSQILAPYVTYLQQLAHHPPTTTPAAFWSQAGRDLLLELLGYDFRGQFTGEASPQQLPPFSTLDKSLLHVDWHVRCHGANHTLAHQAYQIVHQYAWDQVLVPILDRIPHGNGPVSNVDMTPVRIDDDDEMEEEDSEEEPIRIYATRDIIAGEVLVRSYNQCTNCHDRQWYYGTPELLYDYGFVESYPQRYVLEEHHFAFDIDVVEESTKDNSSVPSYQITWIKGVHRRLSSGLEFVQDQLERLRQLAETEFGQPLEENGTLSLDNVTRDPEIPLQEWNTIVQFYNALLIAYREAVVAAGGTVADPQSPGNDCSTGDGTCDLTSVSSRRYRDLLQDEPEVWGDERPMTCDAKWIFKLLDWETVEEIQSPYQHILFSVNPDINDTCFDLDTTVQICASYRPHYHEPMVHYTARFLETVKRVLFVGGGDSMLLHEILKYPSLELVVGLELDQEVTRKSFKYFGTQPHWDNEKVEWWFGDATKSLLMLPKDYFGSFDMVLVDLSETVMALSVTDELDVMQALSLLVKPEGIVVKNEYMYFLDQSEIFSNTLHIHFYDIPVVCSQSLILASDKVDFLRGPVTNHTVNYLLHDVLDQRHHNLLHDYQKNATSFKHCRSTDLSVKKTVEQKQSPGVLMILEAEQVSVDLKATNDLLNLLLKALKSQRLHVLHSPVIKDGSEQLALTIVLEEGYVIARIFPEDAYVAFDIHLWSQFQKHDDIKNALLTAVGGHINGPLSSAYRIVAGGMFGVNGWEEDEQQRGPHVLETCSDSEHLPVRTDAVKSKTMEIVTKELLDRVGGQDIPIAVVCGHDENTCTSLKTLKLTQNTKNIAVVKTCSDIDDSTEFSQDGSLRMFSCEKAVIKALRNFVNDNDKVVGIVVDSDAPFTMGQIMLKIMKSRRNRKRYLADRFLVLTPVPTTSQSWRNALVETFRKEIAVDEPAFSATVFFNSSDSSSSIKLASSGDADFVASLVDTVKVIEDRIDVMASIESIRGGEFRYDEDIEPTHIFHHEDYDLSSQLEQWQKQRQLGHQTVLQYEYEVNGTHKSLSCSSIAESSKAILGRVRVEISATLAVKEVSVTGDGCVVFGSWQRFGKKSQTPGGSGGNFVILWDGRNHVDANVFTYAEDEDFILKFEKFFGQRFSGMKRTLRDTQPRGTGRIVSFASDVTSIGSNPHWHP